DSAGPWVPSSRCDAVQVRRCSGPRSPRLRTALPEASLVSRRHLGLTCHGLLPVPVVSARRDVKLYRFYAVQIHIAPVFRGPGGLGGPSGTEEWSCPGLSHRSRA